MTARRLAPAVLFAAAASLRGQTTPEPRAADLVPRPPGPVRNAVADELCRKAPALGIDIEPDDPDFDRAAPEDATAVRASGAGGWLNSQLSVADDSIGPEPKTLRDFLEGRQSALWPVVCALEKGVPEWSTPMGSREGLAPRALTLIRLDRVLLAAALSAERAGRPAESARLLEASWSLFESFARGPTLIENLLALAVMKMQSGALRKLREAPVPWLDRLSRDDPWSRALETYEGEPKNYEPNTRARKAAAEPLRRVAPCALAEISNDEIARPMVEEYRRSESGPESAAFARIMTDMQVPQLRNVLERAGRTAIESELTAKILELRLARAASRDGKWPATLEDDASRVCPGAVYSYRRNGSEIMIAFEGSAPAPPTPEGALALPLSFSTRADRRAPAPTASPTPALTATPPPSN
ncbi:MAG TPA: hypothetical protein VIA45_12335 [Thermoanaerobaculia bacterium]